MSDEPAPVIAKEYWRDKRLGVGPPRVPPPGRQANLPRNGNELRAMHRNLRHPLMSFLVVILAVILASVGLLAATGGGALSSPQLRLADCAPAKAALLGAPGAQFTASFLDPAPRPFAGPAVDGSCSYAISWTDGDPARPLSFAVTASAADVHVPGWSDGVAQLPEWIASRYLRRVSRDGASGWEAFECKDTVDWCYGWLKLTRGRATWVATATGNAKRLASIEAFADSLRPAP